MVDEYTFSTAVHVSKTIPVALNSFALWLALMIGLTLINYGYPVASLLFRSDTSVPAIQIGGPQR